MLVAMAALAWPSVLQMIQQARLDRAAENVRRELEEARLRSLETSIPHQVRFEPQGGRLVVLPDDPAVLANTAFGTDASNSELLLRFSALTLPEGLAFQAAETASDTLTETLPVEWFNGLEDADELAGTAWSSPVVFYPDGTAIESAFDIVDESGRSVRVTVRGLTGAIALRPQHRRSEP